ncbi:MAG: hypothetical protein II921_00890, partial [Treponema sp.]|nr:hypothetical protein [Treponema sp.]
MKSMNKALALGAGIQSVHTKGISSPHTQSISLDEKERLRRDMILNGPEVKTIFLIALPLVFYNSL